MGTRGPRAIFTSFRPAEASGGGAGVRGRTASAGLLGPFLRWRLRLQAPSIYGCSPSLRCSRSASTGVRTMLLQSHFPTRPRAIRSTPSATTTAHLHWHRAWVPRRWTEGFFTTRTGSTYGRGLTWSKPFSGELIRRLYTTTSLSSTWDCEIQPQRGKT